MTSTQHPELAQGGLALQRLKDLILSGDGHVFDSKTGRSYHINPTGRLALLLLQEGRSEPEVASTLAARFGQHPAVIAVGVETFANQLRRYLP